MHDSEKRYPKNRKSVQLRHDKTATTPPKQQKLGGAPERPHYLNMSEMSFEALFREFREGSPQLFWIKRRIDT